MKFIPLTRGYAAIVDDADYARVMEAGPWYAAVQRRTGLVYAERHIRKVGGKQRLHALILGVGPEVLVDHHNRYPLDNRRVNLRIATGSQNAARAYDAAALEQWGAFAKFNLGSNKKG
jgi:hypothetical protein